ncbi:MAG: HAD-IA family hydrolase [Clostridiales bacterium]|nr:HAD-IA family hydrolase [Clostridiales bacterium]
MNRFDTVLFDLDGTLLDTLADLADSVNYALQRYDFPTIGVDDTRRFVGNGYAKLIERAIPDGTRNPHFSRCLEEFGNHYNSNMMTHTKPYPGILELLAELKTRNCRMAVVSNKNDSAVKALVKHFFGTYIQTAIGESAEVARKPDPASVYKALEELGADRSSAVYVGDSDVDIFTAQNAGLPCICVGWGFRDKELLEQNGAENIIDQPMELLALLEERF